MRKLIIVHLPWIDSVLLLKNQYSVISARQWIWIIRQQNCS